MLASSHYRNVSKQTTRIIPSSTFEYLSITRMFWQDLKDNALDLCTFGFSNRRLEQTATNSISTITESWINRTFEKPLLNHGELESVINQDALRLLGLRPYNAFLRRIRNEQSYKPSQPSNSANRLLSKSIPTFEHILSHRDEIFAMISIKRDEVFFPALIQSMTESAMASLILVQKDGLIESIILTTQHDEDDVSPLSCTVSSQLDETFSLTLLTEDLNCLLVQVHRLNIVERSQN
ncbi:hypothetical protein Tco_0759842 [Tanacetum coccineum]